MRVYMDRHQISSGTTAEEVSRLHTCDLALQSKYGVRFLTYWFGDHADSGFCLAEAPSADTMQAVHKEAHGNLANRIIEVDARVLEQFLGRIVEPPAGEPWVDTALRTILFTDIEGSTRLAQRLGDAKAVGVLRAHDTIVRDALKTKGGSEVKHTGDGIMASFASVAQAVECAITIQRKLASHVGANPDVPLRVRIGLSAGEPVTENADLFGAAVQLARRVCDYADPGRICVANVVRDLCIGKGFVFENRGEVVLKGFEEPVRLYEVRW